MSTANRPTISKNSSEETWNIFQAQWVEFKQRHHWTAVETIQQLSQCCDDELRKTLPQGYVEMTEEQLMDVIKTLAVIEDASVQHRKKAAIAIGVTVGVGVATAGVAVLAAPLVLGAAGFTAGGVAAGSIAAAIQSAVYGGATTGVFAALQSAGAAGIAASTAGGIGAASGGISAAITGYFYRLKLKKKPKLN